ncbi:MAG TPA: hypothetical protein V6C57_26230 [Coleofasciculaceae cyanobacterium]
MRKLAVLLVSLCWTSPAIAQEYQGNFWVNPQSGRVEKLDLSRSLPSLQSSAVDDEWIEIAQLDGGDRLLIKPSSVRQRHLPGRNTETVFRARFQSANPNAVTGGRDDGTYAASCSDRALTRLSDSQIQSSFDVPTLPGTAGEVLLNWACS